jgi:hypothetical protein
MPLPPKLCPECGEEYVHSAVRCVHCDVDLVHAEEMPERDVGAELPPPAELTAIRVASAGWALALSERLVEAGIPHRIEEVAEETGDAGSRAAGPYGVYVRAADAARARALDGEQLAREIPDLPEDWEAAPEGEGCPACGAALPEAAAECPDCGLSLG